MRDRIDAFIADTLAIEDTGALKRYFLSFFAAYGLDIVGYHYLAQGFKRLSREKGFRISHFPESYIKQYIADDWFEIDPLMEEARTRAEPFFWSEVDSRTDLTDQQRAFFDAGKNLGFIEGVAMPVYARPGDIAYFTLGSTTTDLDYSKAQLLEIQAICQQMHLRFNELTEKAKTPKLSKRETQVLELIAQGKSNTLMGEALGVSPNTIDTLVRRCFEKLGVSSRVEAALAGVAMGLILP